MRCAELGRVVLNAVRYEIEKCAAIMQCRADPAARVVSIRARLERRREELTLTADKQDSIQDLVRTVEIPTAEDTRQQLGDVHDRRIRTGLDLLTQLREMHDAVTEAQESADGNGSTRLTFPALDASVSEATQIASTRVEEDLRADAAECGAAAATLTELLVLRAATAAAAEERSRDEAEKYE